MSGMIFSLFEMTIRMAPIAGLHYREDGEVEPRWMTSAKYYGETADFRAMMA
jgi:hypothetical protein